jgi:hypothetical protein
MKALYCKATASFFKVIDSEFCFTDRELEHIAKSEWLQVDVADGFDGDFRHYTLDGSDMVSIPETEWPENQTGEDSI